MLQAGSVASLLTFTRASVAQDTDAAGAVVEAGVNVLRRGVEPVTLAPRGWQIEGASTNGIRDPRFGAATSGASATTNPNTISAYWSLFAHAGLTVTATKGTAQGIPFVDLHITGTAAGTAWQLILENSSVTLGVLVGGTDPITSSAWFAEPNGAGSGVTGLLLGFIGTGGTFGGQQHSASIKGALTPTLTRHAYSATLAGDRVNVFHSLVLQVTNGAEVNYRLRIGGPQIEKAAFASSLILPPVGTPAATTRAADNLTAALAASWFNFGVSRTNLLPHAEAFDNAAWSKGQLTVTANATTDPLGGSAADKLVESTTAASYHFAVQNVAKAAASATYSYSVYIKDAGRVVALNLQSSGTNGATCRVNPATGSVDGVASVYGTGWSNPSMAVTSVGNGWYRVTLTATSDALTTLQCQVALYSTVVASTIYTGDGTSGVFIWGAQVEATQDAAYFANAPLLGAPEDFSQWTSNTTPNDSTVSVNAATAPDGSQSADKIIPSTASGSKALYRGFAGAVSTQYTGAAYVKAAGYGFARLTLENTGFGANTKAAIFNLTTGAIVSQDSGASATVADAGNGWWRVTVTATADADGGAHIFLVAPLPTGSNAAFAGDGTSGILAWGATVNPAAVAQPYYSAGMRATPYVSTTTAARTVQDTGAGTFVVEAMLPQISPTAASAYMFQIDDGSNANRIILRNFLTSPYVWAAAIVGNVVTDMPNPSGSAVVAGTPFRAAVSLDRSGLVCCTAGGAVTSLAAALPAGLTTLRAGSGIGASYANGFIRKVAYFPFKLTNAQLQAASVMDADLSALFA